jgi:hypothetical protein
MSNAPVAILVSHLVYNHDCGKLKAELFLFFLVFPFLRNMLVKLRHNEHVD